jgi:hypothetical protein
MKELINYTQNIVQVQQYTNYKLKNGAITLEST